VTRHGASLFLCQLWTTLDYAQLSGDFVTGTCHKYKNIILLDVFLALCASSYSVELLISAI